MAPVGIEIGKTWGAPVIAVIERNGNVVAQS